MYAVYMLASVDALSSSIQATVPRSIVGMFADCQSRTSYRELLRAVCAAVVKSEDKVINTEIAFRIALQFSCQWGV